MLFLNIGNNQTDLYSSPTKSSVLEGYFQEGLTPEQKQRLSNVLNYVVEVANKKVTFGELLSYLNNTLSFLGSKGILLKGGVVEYILDGIRTLEDLKDIDVSIIADESAKVTDLSFTIYSYFNQNKQSKFLSQKFSDYFCNVKINNFFDFSFTKIINPFTKEPNPRFRCKLDCREILFTDNSVHYPANYVSHQNLQQQIVEEDIGCSIDELKKMSPSVVAFFTSLFVQGRTGEPSFVKALFSKLLDVYIDHKNKEKNEKSEKTNDFSSVVNSIVSDYLIKHLDHDREACLLFLLDFIILAKWAFENEQFIEDKTFQNDCLKKIWGVIYPHLKKYSSETLFIDFVDGLDNSMNSLDKFLINLNRFAKFYGPDQKSNFMQLKFGKDSQQIFYPTGKNIIKEKKWANLHLFVPNLQCSVSLLQSDLGEPIHAKELYIKKLDLKEDQKVEYAYSKILDIFKLSTFGKIPFTSNYSITELLDNWIQLLKQQEIKNESDESAYLNAIRRICTISYAIADESSQHKELIDLYFEKLFNILKDKKDKSELLKKYLIPFLPNAQYLFGLLSKSQQLQDREKKEYFLLLLPCFKEFSEKNLASNDKHSKLIDILSSNFISILQTIDTEDKKEQNLIFYLVDIIKRKSDIHRILNKPIVKSESILNIDSLKNHENAKVIISKVCKLLKLVLSKVDENSEKEWECIDVLTALLKESLASEEVKNVIIEIIEIAIKKSKQAYAQKYYQILSKHKCLDKKREHELLLKLLDSCKTDLNLSLIEDELRTLVSENNWNFDHAIKLIRWWNKGSKISEDLSDLFFQLLQKIITKEIFSTKESATILEWIGLEVSHVNQQELKKIDSKITDCILVLLKKMMASQERFDLVLFKKYDSILKTISKVSEKFDAAPFIELITKWCSYKGTHTYEDLKTVKEMTSLWPIEKGSEDEINVLNCIVEVLIKLNGEGIVSLIEIFTYFTTIQKSLNERQSFHFCFIMDYVLDRNRYEHLEKFFEIGKKLTIFSNDVIYLSKFLKKLTTHLSVNITKLNKQEFESLNYILYDLKSNLSNNEKEEIARLCLKTSPLHCKEALIWLNESKSFDLILINGIIEKTTNHEIINSIIAYLLEGMKEKKFVIADLQKISPTKLIEKTKGSDQLSELVKLGCEECKSLNKDQIFKFADYFLCYLNKYKIDNAILINFVEMLFKFSPSEPVVKQLFYKLENSSKELLNVFVKHLINCNKLTSEDISQLPKTLLEDLSYDLTSNLIGYCKKEGITASNWNLNSFLSSKNSQELLIHQLINYYFEILLKSSSDLLCWDCLCQLMKNASSGYIEEIRNEVLGLLPLIYTLSKQKSLYLEVAKKILIMVKASANDIYNYLNTSATLCQNISKCDSNLLEHLPEEDSRALLAYSNILSFLANKPKKEPKLHLQSILVEFTFFSSSKLENEKIEVFNTLLKKFVDGENSKDSVNEFLHYIFKLPRQPRESFHLFMLLVNFVSSGKFSWKFKDAILCEILKKIKKFEYQKEFTNGLIILGCEWDNIGFLSNFDFNDLKLSGKEEINYFLNSYFKALGKLELIEESNVKKYIKHVLDGLNQICLKGYFPVTEKNIQCLHEYWLKLSTWEIKLESPDAKGITTILLRVYLAWIINYEPNKIFDFFNEYHLNIRNNKNLSKSELFLKGVICDEIRQCIIQKFFDTKQTFILLTQQVCDIDELIKNELTKTHTKTILELMITHVVKSLDEILPALNQLSSLDRKNYEMAYAMNMNSIISSVFENDFRPSVLKETKKLIDSYALSPICQFKIHRLSDVYNTLILKLLKTDQSEIVYETLENLFDKNHMAKLIEKNKKNEEFVYVMYMALLEHSTIIAFQRNLATNLLMNEVYYSLTSRNIEVLRFIIKESQNVTLVKRLLCSIDSIDCCQCILHASGTMRNYPDHLTNVSKTIEVIGKKVDDLKDVNLFIIYAFWYLINSEKVVNEKVNYYLKFFEKTSGTIHPREYEISRLGFLISYGYTLGKKVAKDYVIELCKNLVKKFSMTTEEVLKLSKFVKDTIPNAKEVHNAISTQAISQIVIPKTSKKKK